MEGETTAAASFRRTSSQSFLARPPPTVAGFLRSGFSEMRLGDQAAAVAAAAPSSVFEKSCALRAAFLDRSVSQPQPQNNSFPATARGAESERRLESPVRGSASSRVCPFAWRKETLDELWKEVAYGAGQLDYLSALFNRLLLAEERRLQRGEKREEAGNATSSDALSRAVSRRISAVQLGLFWRDFAALADAPYPCQSAPSLESASQRLGFLLGDAEGSLDLVQFTRCCALLDVHTSHSVTQASGLLRLLLVFLFFADDAMELRSQSVCTLEPLMALLTARAEREVHRLQQQQSEEGSEEGRQELQRRLAALQALKGCPTYERAAVWSAEAYRFFLNAMRNSPAVDANASAALPESLESALEMAKEPRLDVPYTAEGKPLLFFSHFVELTRRSVIREEAREAEKKGDSPATEESLNSAAKFIDAPLAARMGPREFSEEAPSLQQRLQRFPFPSAPNLQTEPSVSAAVVGDGRDHQPPLSRRCEERGLAFEEHSDNNEKAFYSLCMRPLLRTVEWEQEKQQPPPAVFASQTRRTASGFGNLSFPRRVEQNEEEAVSAKKALAVAALEEESRFNASVVERERETIEQFLCTTRSSRLPFPPSQTQQPHLADFHSSHPRMETQEQSRRQEENHHPQRRLADRERTRPSPDASSGRPCLFGTGLPSLQLYVQRASEAPVRRGSSVRENEKDDRGAPLVLEATVPAVRRPSRIPSGGGVVNPLPQEPQPPEQAERRRSVCAAEGKAALPVEGGRVFIGCAGKEGQVSAGREKSSGGVSFAKGEEGRRVIAEASTVCSRAESSSAFSSATESAPFKPSFQEATAPLCPPPQPLGLSRRPSKTCCLTSQSETLSSTSSLFFASERQTSSTSSTFGGSRDPFALSAHTAGAGLSTKGEDSAKKSKSSSVSSGAPFGGGGQLPSLVHERDSALSRQKIDCSLQSPRAFMRSVGGRDRECSQKVKEAKTTSSEYQPQPTRTAATAAEKGWSLPSEEEAKGLDGVRGQSQQCVSESDDSQTVSADASKHSMLREPKAAASRPSPRKRRDSVSSLESQVSLSALKIGGHASAGEFPAAAGVSRRVPFVNPSEALKQRAAKAENPKQPEAGRGVSEAKETESPAGAGDAFPERERPFLRGISEAIPRGGGAEERDKHRPSLGPQLSLRRLNLETPVFASPPSQAKSSQQAGSVDGEQKEQEQEGPFLGRGVEEPVGSRTVESTDSGVAEDRAESAALCAIAVTQAVGSLSSPRKARSSSSVGEETDPLLAALRQGACSDNSAAEDETWIFAAEASRAGFCFANSNSQLAKFSPLAAAAAASAWREAVRAADELREKKSRSRDSAKNARIEKRASGAALEASGSECVLQPLVDAALAAVSSVQSEDADSNASLAALAKAAIETAAAETEAVFANRVSSETPSPRGDGVVGGCDGSSVAMEEVFSLPICTLPRARSEGQSSKCLQEAATEGPVVRRGLTASTDASLESSRSQSLENAALPPAAEKVANAPEPRPTLGGI